VEKMSCNEFKERNGITGKLGTNKLNKKVLTGEEMDEIFLYDYS